MVLCRFVGTVPDIFGLARHRFRLSLVRNRRFPAGSLKVFGARFAKPEEIRQGHAFAQPGLGSSGGALKYRMPLGRTAALALLQTPYCLQVGLDFIVGESCLCRGVAALGGRAAQD